MSLQQPAMDQEPLVYEGQSLGEVLSLWQGLLNCWMMARVAQTGEWEGNTMYFLQ